MKPQSGVPQSKSLNEPRTEWTSIWIAGAITFFTAVQFTIFFSSLFPFLQELDSTSTESQFGYILAAYSIGEAVANPTFGWASNRLGTTKPPLLFGLAMMNIGAVIYFFVPYIPLSATRCLMLSRMCSGIGAGIGTVLRAYAAQASTPETRARAMAMVIGGFSLGIIVGPGLQLFFTPIGYPGFDVLGFSINMYSCVAILNFFVNTCSMLLVILFFKESTVGIYQQDESSENAEHTRFFALPSCDWVAVGLCCLGRFSDMFMIVNLDTLESPLSIVYFNWTRRQAVFYNALCHVAFGGVAIIIFGANIIWDFGKHGNHRVLSMLSLFLMLLYYLVTFPWPGLPGKIEFQQEYIEFNGTSVLNPNPSGCRRSLEWCADLAPVNVWVFYIACVACLAVAFPLTSISMNVVYSRVIGPRKQGTLTGVMMLFGSMGQLLAPLVMAPLFEMGGPRIPWLIVITVLSIVLCGWFVFYDRLVPLKLHHELTAGESYRNKHGKVIKF